jgi:hypothetical protein
MPTSGIDWGPGMPSMPSMGFSIHAVHKPEARLEEAGVTRPR